ncbi:Transmembrane domain-containing protein [Spironucleus salmonicida]|uniref:Transmembrane domain-containing protein n=1 Tax=Spironucleus salmonicida TaxID=348837 RepID=V6LX86_9EUKA|nr:Transmembrane domain-containing protein [Spironucleus salmonicida]|eukprot:EST48863.1 Transmembrane domain-containing protein [Spironucleus salmonicida]
MDGDNADRGSEMSFGSSSGSSSASKHAQVDEITLRMGTDPIKQLIPRSYPVHLVSHLLPQISKTIEIAVVTRFLGIEAVQPMILLQPIYELISMHISFALASSANIFASRNISKNQIVAANIYFAHYFVAAFVWGMIAIVLYFAALQTFFTSEIVGQYLLIRAGVASITNIFSRSLTPFLKSESRYFVVLIRDITEQLLFIGFLVNCYVNSTYIGISLTNAAIAYIVSNGIITIWMFILIMKYNFLDVEYRGVLKFQFKRLSPIRPKILLQIIANCFTPLLNVATDSILMLEAVLFVQYLVKQEDYKLIQNVRLLVFTRVKALLQSLHFAFRDVFAQLAGYNMGVKKVTRIYETFVWTVIYQYAITIPICLIAIYVSQFLAEGILPIPPEEKTPFFYYNIKQSVSAAMAGAWCMLLPIPYYLSIAFMQLESKSLMSALLQLPMLVFGCGYLYYTLYEIADNSPLYLIIALAEVINAIIGYGFIVFYFIKYSKLHKLNKNRKDPTQDTVAAQAAANDEIRQSVMVELTKTADQEEEDKKTKERQSVTNLFNKNVALRSSKQFMSLRESVGGETLQGGDSRQSTVRVSQLNRDSVAMQ